MRLYFYVKNDQTLAIDTENKVFTQSIVLPATAPHRPAAFVRICDEEYQRLLADVIKDGYEPNWYADRKEITA